jgi:hypothetical protein
MLVVLQRPLQLPITPVVGWNEGTGGKEGDREHEDSGDLCQGE